MFLLTDLFVSCTLIFKSSWSAFSTSDFTETTLSYLPLIFLCVFVVLFFFSFFNCFLEKTNELVGFKAFSSDFYSKKQ